MLYLQNAGERLPFTARVDTMSARVFRQLEACFTRLQGSASDASHWMKPYLALAILAYSLFTSGSHLLKLYRIGLAHLSNLMPLAAVRPVHASSTSQRHLLT